MRGHPRMIVVDMLTTEEDEKCTQILDTVRVEEAALLSMVCGFIKIRAKKIGHTVSMNEIGRIVTVADRVFLSLETDKQRSMLREQVKKLLFAADEHEKLEGKDDIREATGE